MRKKLLNTSSLSLLVVLTTLCLILYLILRPEHISIVYIINIITSFVVCVGASIMISLPRRRYFSNSLKACSWIGLVILGVYSFVGLVMYQNNIYNELAPLNIASGNNESLTSEQVSIMNQLAIERTHFLTVYYTTLCLIACLWTTLLILLNKRDMRSAEYANFIDKGYEKRAIAHMLHLSSDKYREVCQNNNIYPEFYYRFEHLVIEIKGIDSNVMDISEGRDKLKYISSSLSKLINDMEISSNIASFNEKVKLLTNEHIETLRQMKVEYGV